jgi:GNAT superfamily N-acetyltransferase
MWRPAKPDEDDLLVEMCLALNREDPGEPVTAQQIRLTLSALRAAPVRGRAVVAEVEGQVVGYALLISFWSNEYGGELCTIDELYVSSPRRGGGIATGLFEAIVTDRSVWPHEPAALQLEVTPKNARARAFYERLGFHSRNQLLRRRVSTQ